MTTANQTGPALATISAAQERRPFLRLAPHQGRELPSSARRGLPALESLLGEEVAGLVQCLVKHGLEMGYRRKQATWRLAPPPVSVLNRRRRAARQWVQTLLSGRVDATTLREVGTVLLPQLAGAGPEGIANEHDVWECIEYLRGAATARLFDTPQDNLIPNAKALHTLETLLAIHLDAYQQTVATKQAAH